MPLFLLDGASDGVKRKSYAFLQPNFSYISNIGTYVPKYPTKNYSFLQNRLTFLFNRI
nr:MAG TPA: hypothetical protein [Caudoviricetes sp.]